MHSLYTATYRSPYNDSGDTPERKIATDRMKAHPEQTGIPASSAGTPHAANTINYRPDIDGLRAISVMAVMVYHFFPQALPGGLVGVDIIFVISGYLINKILLEQNRIDGAAIKTFYARRIKRIFPALLIVMWCTFAFGWISLYADEFKELGKHIMGGAGFASNLVYLAEAGYFDASAEQKPLLHLWSLAVEEQFYLFWPLLLIAVTGTPRRRLMVKVLWAASFAGNLYLSYAHPDVAYYLPLTRFWEILTGAMLAFAEHDLRTKSAILDVSSSSTPTATSAHKQDTAIHAETNASTSKDTNTSGASPHTSIIPTLINRNGGMLGLFMLAASIVLVDGHANFPGWQALIPVVGAWLLIRSGGVLATQPAALVQGKMTSGLQPPNLPLQEQQQEQPANTQTLSYRLLANRGMVLIGLISYPLYLWHWPIIAYLKITELQPSVALRLAGIALTFAAATLTYLLLEKKLRHRKGWTVAVLVILMMLMAAIGHNIWSRNGLDFRQVNYTLYKQKALDAIASATGLRALQGDTNEVATLNFDRATFEANNPDYAKHLRDLALRMQADPALYQRIKNDFEAINQQGFQCVGNACDVPIGLGPKGMRPRVVIIGDSHAENFFSALDSTHRHLDVVRFTLPGCAPMQSRYKSEDNRCSQLMKQAREHLAAQRTDLVILAARWPDNYAPVSQDIETFGKLAARVALAGPSLTFTADGSKIMLRYNSSDDIIDHVNRYIDASKFAQNAAMKAFAAQQGVGYVDKIEALCKDGICRMTLDGTQLFVTDYGHLSAAGAAFLGSELMRAGTLKELLGASPNAR